MFLARFWFVRSMIMGGKQSKRRDDGFHHRIQDYDFVFPLLLLTAVRKHPTKKN
jgi:hypothetical protein